MYVTPFSSVIAVAALAIGISLIASKDSWKPCTSQHCPVGSKMRQFMPQHVVSALVSSLFRAVAPSVWSDFLVKIAYTPPGNPFYGVIKKPAGRAALTSMISAYATTTRL